VKTFLSCDNICSDKIYFFPGEAGTNFFKVTKHSFIFLKIRDKMLIRNFAVIFLSVLQLIDADVANAKCGLKVYPTGLMIGGTVSKKNDWPWLAALIHLESNKYFCCGAIISKNHILTAAHCLRAKKPSTHDLKAGDIFAFLGRHNLSKPYERGTELFHPTEIYVHPHWKVHSKRYDADLAILYSEDSIRFKNGQISPVCLWHGTERIEGDIELTAVGWGKTENILSNVQKHSDVPIQAQIKTINKEICYEENPQLAEMSTRRLFCASGVVSNSGPCTGDSGKL
jgi:trypsin